MVVEVADHQVDGEAVVLVGQRGGGRRAGTRRSRRRARSGPACRRPGARSSRTRVLSQAPAPSSTECVGLGQLGDGGGVLLEQRPLGPGGVVLGELGDLLEQAAAPLVVEPHGRDRLRSRPAARSSASAPSALAHLFGREVDVDRCRPIGSGVPGQSHAAERPAGAGREEVAIGGTHVARGRDAASAAEHVLAHHELAVVLADRTGRRRGTPDTGSRRSTSTPRRPRRSRSWSRRAGVRRPVGEDVVIQEVVARHRALPPIVSHSDSVGSRMPVQWANASAS